MRHEGQFVDGSARLSKEEILHPCLVNIRNSVSDQTTKTLILIN